MRVGLGLFWGSACERRSPIESGMTRGDGGSACGRRSRVFARDDRGRGERGY